MNQQVRDKIKDMAAHGYPVARICRAVGLTGSELMQQYRAEIDAGWTQYRKARTKRTKATFTEQCFIWSDIPRATHKRARRI